MEAALTVRFAIEADAEWCVRVATLDSPDFVRRTPGVNEVVVAVLGGSLVGLLTAVVIDVSAAVSNDRDYLISREDCLNWERRHGRIPDGVIVLFNTGYHRFWPDRIRYMGTAERGAEAVAKLHFPGLDPVAARWLTDQRRISAVGLDTPSIDFGQSRDFMSHRILFEANIPAFENVALLSEVPATGAIVFALPMKIRGGSGGPLRIVALVPE